MEPLTTYSVAKRHLQLRRAVCKAFGVSWQQVTGPGRKRAEATARQVYCYLSAELFTWKCQELIADEVCRHRSTVACSIKTVKDWIQVNDAYLLPRLEQIKQELK